MPGYLALLYLPNVDSFGLAAVEAMAASLPVIACTSTAVPGIAGAASLSVDAHSPPAIVATIRELRDSSASRAAWIARGTSRAAAFTWPACVARLAAALIQ
jgi:glycosyltransferase involved in cell wall biosynthesis